MVMRNLSDEKYSSKLFFGMLDPKPFEAACFPYAQHFVTTSIPTATTMRTVDDLEQAVTEINDEMQAPEEMDC